MRLRGFCPVWLSSVIAAVMCVPAALAQVEEVSDYGDTRANSDFAFYTPPTDATPYSLSKQGAGASRVKNVILMIGDGMADAHIALARGRGAASVGALYMEKLPVRGRVTTHSLNGVTDSAAAGTALACGIKTRNKTIGMDTNGVAYVSILGASKAIGKQTAIVVTSTVSHATPASFCSNVKNRGSESAIAAQMLENRVNIMLGGGKKFWLPSAAKGGDASGARNLVNEAREAGYVVVEDAVSLSKAEGAYVLGLFQMGAMTTSGDEPSLPQMTRDALRILGGDGASGGNGFFMMIEGSQIDWAGHANNTDNCIKQTLLFDLAVKEAMDFAMADGNTLVVVTSDHETGGLSVDSSQSGNPVATWKSKGHTDEPVPLFAFGPGADTLVDVKDNTDIPKRIASVLAIEDFPGIKE